MGRALEKATYKQLDDRTWFAEILGFTGVWANAPTVEACRSELLGVLEEWLLLKLVPRCFEWVAEETVVNKAPLAKIETQDEER